MRTRLLVLAVVACLAGAAPGLAAQRQAFGRPSAAAPVKNIAQFNSWLATLNGQLGFSAPDLAAISLRASQILAAAPRGASVKWDAAAAKINFQAPAAAATAIDLKRLPQLRKHLQLVGDEAQAWFDGVAGADDPAALAVALNGFFDRSAVAAPSAAAAESVGRSAHLLSTELVLPGDGARERQKDALLAWQRSPRRTYVLVNSYSFKDDGTPGLNYYDMRSLAQILWAADPGVDVIFVTALPVDESMVRHVLQGRADAEEIRKRVHFVALEDSSSDFLSQKLLDPKHVGKLAEIRRIVESVGSPAALYPYMGGPHEWRIAEALGLPDSVYAPHPSLIYWGTKSGGRKVARAALSRYAGTRKVRMKLVEGVEDVYDIETAAAALEAMRERDPRLSRVAFKLNYGSSGEGNLFPKVAGRKGSARELLKRSLAATIGIPDETGKIDTFADVMASEGSVLEAFIPGIDKATFPSVQMEILPDGAVRLLSSHEQILIDRNNYVGATLSAHKAYRAVVERAALEVGRELAAKGIVGRFGTDFAAVPRPDGGHDVYFIENNIRLTGTTHPLVTAAGLTGTAYRRGALRAPGSSAAIRYKSVDHDVRPNLVGLGVDGFLGHFDRDENKDVLFDPEKRSGVLFHLVPAIREAGNVAYTIIADSVGALQRIQERLTEILNRLELEYLAGVRADELTYRFKAQDAREQVELQLGHARQVKLFRAFLELHSEDLYSREKDRGIVFHPHGYTVVGWRESELADLTRKAEKLLEQFAAEAASRLNDPS